MADKWTQTLIPTSRQVPAEAEVPSHQLMLRAGFIRKLAAGSYAYLPLGLRSLNKACQIIRDEMNSAGAIEVLLPALQPIELWEQSKRREAYGENLFVVKDRHGREQALGPTHEEVVTDIVGAYAKSYKDLPLTLYQIQTKFRDEFRPRFGVLRSREFQMKDAYSFHTELAGGNGSGSLDETYQKQFDAYKRIFTRCGLPYEIVEAESGPIGGSASHEFMVPSPTGEDVIFKSDKGNYAANVEKCATGKRAWNLTGEPLGEMEEIHTPAQKSIDDLCNFFKRELKTRLKASDTLKTLVCKIEGADSKVKWLLAVVRGDHGLNEGKLKEHARQWAATMLKEAQIDIELADENEAQAAGFTVGYVGPQIAKDRDDVALAIDFDVAHSKFWVTGANKTEYHVKLFDWCRDAGLTPGDTQSSKWLIADIRNAVAGDPSPKEDGGVLTETHGIEIGHVFKLGSKYTDAFNVTVLGENNEPRTIYMGCYGIGVNRLLASAIEAEGGHDEDGIIWPAGLAPYHVLITPIKYDGEVKKVVDELAAKLEKLGMDVLIDDRDERPGVKFKDADLIGMPVRVTVGEKGLAQGLVEIKTRDGSMGSKGEQVVVEEALERIQSVFTKNG